ncbi:MAG: hypothetical protein H0X29_05540 [Parachlamydiaceae bacterium]|nr:hypothetical protein [Parachlamydiaceae bacterium]
MNINNTSDKIHNYGSTSSEEEKVDSSTMEKKISASFMHTKCAIASSEIPFSTRIQQGNWCVLLANEPSLTKDAAKTLLTLAIKEFNLALHQKFDKSQEDSYVHASEKLIKAYLTLIQLELSDNNIDEAVTYSSIAREACLYLKKQAPHASWLKSLLINWLTAHIKILDKKCQNRLK